MGKGTKISVKVKGSSPHKVKKALATLVGMPELFNEPRLREADFRLSQKKK